MNTLAMESSATCLRLIADWLVTNRQLVADGLQCQIQHEAILPSWHHFTTSVVMMISAVLETNWAWYIKCGKSKLRASRSQQNHYNHNRSVLICCKRNNFILLSWWQLTQERFYYFQTFYSFEKNVDLTVANLSPISRRPLADLYQPIAD